MNENEATSTVKMKVGGFLEIGYADGTVEKRPFEGVVDVPADEDGMPLDPEIRAQLPKE
jgi:hypothetical protein